MVFDPPPVATPQPEGRWQGFERLRSVASALVWSLNPCYDPQNAQPLAGNLAAKVIGTDSPGHENQASHSLPFTALAARAIAACANLPPEINQALDYLANLANLVGAGRVPCDHSSNYSEIASPENNVSDVGQ